MLAARDSAEPSEQITARRQALLHETFSNSAAMHELLGTRSLVQG